MTDIILEITPLASVSVLIDAGSIDVEIVTPVPVVAVGVGYGGDTPPEILNKLKTVDGAGSGLDADTITGIKITVSPDEPPDPEFGDLWIDV